MDTSATEFYVPGERKKKNLQEALLRTTQLSVSQHESASEVLVKSRENDLALRGQGPHSLSEEKYTIPYTQLPAGSQCILSGGSTLYRPVPSTLDDWCLSLGD